MGQTAVGDWLTAFLDYIPHTFYHSLSSTTMYLDIGIARAFVSKQAE